MPATSRPLRRVSHRTALLGAVAALVLSTCASGFGTGLDGEGSLIRSASQFAAVDVPQPLDLAPPSLPTGPPAGNAGQAASARPRATAALALEPVTALQPKIRLVGDIPGRDLVQEAMSVPGVVHATAISIGTLPVQGPTGSRALRVAAVDPGGFRVLTPQVTADAVEVWKRIVEGDAAFTHDVGYGLGLDLGGRIPAGPPGGSLRVGAFASNGVPPVAEAVVSQETARNLGLDGEQALLVSIAGDQSPEAVAALLAEATGLEPEVLEDPVPREAFLTGSDARRAFQPFTYIDNGDGMIQIDPGWVRRNIVSAQVPIFRGHVVCHRLIIHQLRGALQEIEDKGLAHLIDPTQYGGCWVPRHIDFNPAKPLSMHSWGLAIDFNVSTNQLGAVPKMDRRIVQIFESWGFVWGGHWRRPDGMHFELGALMQSPGG
jgi:hypothetical protein